MTVVPEPNVPEIADLKPLHLTSALVASGQPCTVIVTPPSEASVRAAKCIQQVIQQITGVVVPIENDTSSSSVLRKLLRKDNLICLGNRSTNGVISKFYDRFFTLIDLKYPGPKGHVLQTLHSPFGNGCNVILVGGSDDEGVTAAADQLMTKLDQAGGCSGELSVDWLQEVKISDAYQVTREVQQMEIWEASLGVGSRGYFGWNSISKHMAMFAMTGDPWHAREFLRLAFPDAQAQKELTEIDGELVENKADPLSGSYHYGAHIMILLWDLIEESPVFNDEDRLRVTRAFARQLGNRLAYVGDRREVDVHHVYDCSEPSPRIGTRHNIYHALCLFCVARYFQRDYPAPVWEQCLRGVQNYFSQLHTPHPFVHGEAGTSSMYCTCVAPLLTYVLLSGDRAPVKNGALTNLLHEQEVLISGTPSDPALQSASLDYVHKAAYLMKDGRWLTYRDRLGMNTDVFRLGQSFWPGPDLQPAPLKDLVGKWTVCPLSPNEWRSRGSGLTETESFSCAGYRSALDETGDLILLNGRNAFGRHPYFSFAVNELRVDGCLVLDGFRNQVLTRADGLMEPQVALDAALKYEAVIGKTVMAVAEVPRSAFCNWRRTLAHRIGGYTLLVDELTMQTASEHFEAEFLWQTLAHQWQANQPGILTLFDDSKKALAEIHAADPLPAQIHFLTKSTWDPASYTSQKWVGTTVPGQRRLFFSLIGLSHGQTNTDFGCWRLAENAAALCVPTEALSVVGEYAGIRGEFVLLSANSLTGRGIKRVSLPSAEDNDQVIFLSDRRVGVDWDFQTGELVVDCHAETEMIFTTAISDHLILDSQTCQMSSDDHGLMTVKVSSGRHLLQNLRPTKEVLARLHSQLELWISDARQLRNQTVQPTIAERMSCQPARELQPILSHRVDGPVVDTVVVEGNDGPQIHMAAANHIHIFAADGQLVQRLSTDGPIRMLHWWPEPELLLAGCVDEKVIAFDRQGNRLWTFTSEMDPAVTRAGKPYWFKSSPGHEGIHGLSSGVFLDGQSQAFVGSACTLEIIDDQGRLVKRLPQFWGTVHQFAVVPGPNGSRDLLASRRIADVADLAIVNSQTIDPTVRGYQDVPPGVTNADVWGNETSHHIFIDDVDDDGHPEIVREITGVWNRVTVWSIGGTPVGCINYLDEIDFTRGPQQGVPKYNVHFGSGEVPSRGVSNAGTDEFEQALIRDLEVADLDGAGHKEILVVLANGWFMVFNGRCERLFAHPLDQTPTVLEHVGRLVAIGTEEGRILGMDSSGALRFAGQVDGRVTGLTMVNDNCWVTTVTGKVSLFRIGQQEVASLHPQHRASSHPH